MLALGFLHGLGADHLMAIAALSLATPLGPARYARAFGLALKFAVGHALLLASGAGMVLFFGWQIPVRFEQGGELIGGCLLIVLGLIVGWLTWRGRLYVHSHPHEGGETGPQPLASAFWPCSIRTGRRFTRCCRVVLGAVFAISGLRALILSLPLWNAAEGPHHFWSLLFLVSVFALGILMSMSLFGIVLAHTLAARRMAGHVAGFSAARHCARLARAGHLLDLALLAILCRFLVPVPSSAFEEGVGFTTRFFLLKRCASASWRHRERGTGTGTWNPLRQFTGL